MGSLQRLFLFTVISALARPAVSGPTRDVLAIFPLTGTETLRGKAQQAGYQVALSKLDLPSDIVLHINDTQCSARREGQLLAWGLQAHPPPIAVLGGGCLRTERDQAQNDWSPNSGLNNIIPQVLFEENAFPADASAHLFNVRPSVASLDRAILAFIFRNRWRRIAIVHSGVGVYHQAAQAFRSQGPANGVDVALVINARNGQLWNILKASRLRVVILYMDHTTLTQALCGHASTLDLQRYTFLLPGLATSLPAADRFPYACRHAMRVVTFEVARPFIDSQRFAQFSEDLVTKDATFQDLHLRIDAAFTHDAAELTLTSVRRLSSLNYSASNLRVELMKAKMQTVTGELSLDSTGRRTVNITLSYYNNETLTRMGTYDQDLHLSVNLDMPLSLNDTHTHDGIAVPVFAIMTSLALLGIIFSVCILVFNITTQKNRVIKMTSPNLNIIILLGCVTSYATVILLGLDSRLVSLSAMNVLHQASTYTMTISFSLIYGSTFAKSWRVFIIFNNLQFNKKTTRDEHLILVVLLLVLIDIVILLPWTFADPLVCTTITATETHQGSDVIRSIDTCNCKYFPLWIALIYVFKSLILAVGIYFTWKTRHITLPVLKDANYHYVIVYSVVSMAILMLPVLLTSPVQIQIKYLTGSIVILILTTITIILLFVTKIPLYRKDKTKESTDLVKFLFSESMRKTQETKTKGCFGRCFGCKDNDPYAQDMIATEVENLKKTIKEKDASIRELTDRLFFGSEKFQEYLRTPKYHPSYRAPPPQIQQSPPPQEQTFQREIYTQTPDTYRPYRRSSAKTSSTTYLNEDMELSIKEPITNSLTRQKSLSDYPKQTAYPIQKDRGTNSPNHDSAIDNSPPYSSDSSDEEIQEYFMGNSHIELQTKSPGQYYSRHGSMLPSYESTPKRTVIASVHHHHTLDTLLETDI